MKKRFLVNHKHFPVNGLLIISMMFTLIANTFLVCHIWQLGNKTIWLHPGIK